MPVCTWFWQRYNVLIITTTGTCKYLTCKHTCRCFGTCMYICTYVVLPCDSIGRYKHTHIHVCAPLLHVATCLPVLECHSCPHWHPCLLCRESSSDKGCGSKEERERKREMKKILNIAWCISRPNTKCMHVLAKWETLIHTLVIHVVSPVTINTCSRVLPRKFERW